jgi:pimeloyl-ACP methyl ester carboxylesterase
MPLVHVNGINLNYTEQGQGEPLILIMGLGADGSLWKDHVQAYAQHFRCIMVDNRGAGGSDKPPGPYSTTMMADDVAGLMDALGMEQAQVAGISMGGAIAQSLAIHHPRRVRRMILISTWARCDTYTKVVFEHFMKMRAAADPGDFTELLQLWIYASDYLDEHLSDLQQGQRDARDDPDPMPRHAFDAQCAACITHDAFDRLSAIRCPALLTVGDADIFTPLHFSIEIRDRIAGSEMFVLKRAGHAHHWEKLDEFNRKTTEFLLGH